MSSDDCFRLSATEAIDRLRDWVTNLDVDELARMVSECCPHLGRSANSPVVVFDDMGGADDSAPYLGGRRGRWAFVPEQPDITTTGKSK